MVVRSESKSAMSLVELMVAVLILGLAALACIGLFLRATAKADESRDRSFALVYAESAAEAFKAADGKLTLLYDILETKDDGSGTATVYYTEDWVKTDDITAPFRVRVEPVSSKISTARVSVRRLGKIDPILQLDVKKYAPAT